MTTAVIVEHVGGECLYTRYVFLAVRDDGTSATVLGTEYRDTSIADAVLGSVRAKPIRAGESARAFADGLSAPVEEASFRSAYMSFEPYPAPSPELWNATMGRSGIASPTSREGPLEIVYWWPAGLYFGYTVEAVHLLDEKGTALVITSNGAPGRGADTRHGFLVVRPAEKDSAPASDPEHH